MNTNTGMYKCKVRWWNEEVGKEETVFLAVYGVNYEDVAHHIGDYYGEDILSMKLEQVNDSNLIFVTKEIYQSMEPTF